MVHFDGEYKALYIERILRRLSPRYQRLKCLILKLYVNAIRDGTTPWRISTSIKVMASLFMLVLTVSETLRFEKFDLENVDQGHGVQHSQWIYSMTDVKRVIIRIFVLSSNRF